MSPATRTQALAKLKTLYFGIGYPDTWQDYSDLAVDPHGRRWAIFGASRTATTAVPWPGSAGPWT